MLPYVKPEKNPNQSVLLAKRNRKKINSAKEEVKEEINKIIKKRKEKREFIKPDKKQVTFD